MIVIFILYILLLLIRIKKYKKPIYFYIENFDNYLSKSKKINKDKLLFCKTQNYELSKIIRESLQDINAKYTNDPKKCDIVIPFWYSDKEINKYYKENDYNLKQIVHVIPGVDEINRKKDLWKHLVNKYNRKIASTIIPETYIIDDKKEYNLFLDNYKNNPNSTFVLKNEEENAKGVFFIKGINNIRKKIHNKNLMYPITVIQKFVEPFLINNRCFKLRLFLLIKCHNSNKKAWIHKNGSLFYAKRIYDKNNKTFDNSVANSYWYKNFSENDIKNILKNSPINLKEFSKYLKNIGKNYNIIFEKIKTMLEKCIKAVDNQICNINKYKKNIKLGLYGVDIIFDKNFKPWVIEFNISPSTKLRNNKNYILKKKVWSDSYKLALTDNLSNTNFIKIY